MSRTIPCWGLVCLLAAAGSLAPACTAGGRGDPEKNPELGSGSGSNADPDDLPALATSEDAPAPPGCGDGVLTEDEACDDGNRESDDGCAANCLSVQRGFSCNPPGQLCQRIARCGDGVASFPELCDDGNTTAGDGCSPTCKVEVGYKCGGSPSVCTPTVCGDSIVEGAESCDDGNARPYDGCSALCQTEPDCSAGACSSECGDGLVLGEDCDDGNNTDGDGCSADCQVEEGYVCEPPPLGGSMVVPVVYRDFRAGGDFEPGDAIGKYNAMTGLVEQALDGDGKPVFAGQAGTGYITSAESFSHWYRDVDGTNSTTVSQLVLYNDGAGRYVNRYGPNGEQWLDVTLPGENWCGNLGEEVNGEPCTFVYGGTVCDERRDELFDCVQRDNTWSGIFLEAALDGNPVFFPVDDDAFTPAGERAAALISTAYGGNWQPEEGSPLHNFHFTSEVRYWFQYHAGQRYILDFTGDDDVWVFINDQLAVDLGGIHTAVSGTLDITASGTASVTITQSEPPDAIPAPTVQDVVLPLDDGSVYEIAVFHAERKKEASTFKLTLDGFATSRSECSPICGDGIVSLGEECDDGDNDGGYGECAPGCTLGAFCGDGIVQEGEDCDDGNNVDGDGCGSACREVILL